MSKTILVVDDDDPIRRMLVRLLGLASPDLEIVDVEDGFAAVEQLRARSFDLIVLDQMMPDMSGLEVLKTLRSEEINKNSLVIMLTARTDQDHVMTSLESGADYFLAKPFEPQQLLELVAECLGLEPPT